MYLCENTMIMETKFDGFYRIFNDILRDTNSTKYSMTKFTALIGLVLLIATVISSLIIMIHKGEIDHVLLVELIGFVLTLEGFKNSFGFGNKDNATLSGNSDGKAPDALDTSSVKQLVSDVTSDIKTKETEADIKTREASKG